MPAQAKLVGEELPEFNQLRKLPNPMKNMEVLCNLKENPWETWEQNMGTPTIMTINGGLQRGKSI